MRFRQFMAGRNGADKMTHDILIISLVCMLLSTFTGILALNLLGTVGYIYVIFRIFSRNIAKRYEENRKYVLLRQNVCTSVKQAYVRLKNTRKYKYFKCPQCGSWLRLPRKVGEVTITCGKCRHAFPKKA